MRERLSRIATSVAWIACCVGALTIPALTCPTASLADPIQLAGVTVAVVPPSPCAGDSVFVQFSTCACATRFTSAGWDASGGLELVVANDPSIVCIRCDSLLATVPIGRFAAGSFVLAVQVVVHYGPDGRVDSTRVFPGTLSYQVRGDCGPGPTPGIPYLDSVHVGGPAPCDSCPGVACPGDSIPVVLAGTFPQAGYELDHVEVVPSMIVGPLPAPDVVRIYYRACHVGVIGPVPWSAAVRIAPLPPGGYTVGLEGFLDTTCDSAAAGFVGALSVPFAVQDSCPSAPPRCFLAGFVHASGGCDGAVGPNLPADVAFAVRTTVPLAGLQGRFAFDTPGLRVTDLEAIGNAAGMLLSWQPVADGASFVLVAPSGAPILPVVPPDGGAIPGAAPVLRVRVSAVAGAPVPDHARLAPLDIVAADANGIAVPTCALRQPNLYVDPAAHLCRASACDFNGDGVTDVRDLVVMAHCVLDSTACPPGAADHLDCNDDGVTDVSDVLCCARILLAGLRGGAPGARPDPDVRVALGVPRSTAAGVDVPVTLLGLAGVGAARVDFSYPDARYVVTSVDGAATGWLTLDQAGDGKLALGMVALGTNAAQALPVVVHLALKAGQSAGGEFGVEGGEFAGQDGAALTTQVTAVTTPLAAGAAVALSAPRPNPFAGSTSFTLTLTRAQAVDVGVFDLAGRRVATLFHGPAAAGATPLAWDRARGNGAPVGAGMYFIRVATARGEVAASKVLDLSRE